MEANELPSRLKPEEEHMTVGVRFVDDAWGSEAEWNKYEEVTELVHHHDNAHGERVFSVIGPGVPGFFVWALESDIMFVSGSEEGEL